MSKCIYCDESFKRIKDSGKTQSYWWVEPAFLCGSCTKRYIGAKETWFGYLEKAK